LATVTHDRTLSGVQYKGFTVHHLLAYVAERYGDSFKDEVVEALPETLRRHADPARTLAASWVPAETYFGILQYVVDVKNSGEARAAARIGYEVTVRDIHAFFKMVLKFTSPSMVMFMSRRLWRTYCDQGELVHLAKEPGLGVLQLRDFKISTPVAMHELAGGFRAYLECSSAQAVEIEVLPPLADGTLQWQFSYRT
jgi:hypothetical protein